MNQQETLELIKRSVSGLKEKVHAWNKLVAGGHRDEDDETRSALIEMLKFWEGLQADLSSHN